jgi:tripartite-type tricarboxylate transporter receptor subunit TctC
MHLRRRDFLKAAMATACTSIMPRLVAAEAYPSRTVRLVVGFPAGGPVDIAGRFIAPWLAQRFAQEFVVDNKPGQSGNAATKLVVTSESDGNTLLICGPVNTINTTLFKELDFDFTRDIAPVAALYSVPLVVEVHPSVPVRTPAEFIAHAKAMQRKLRIGFAGKGTPQHVGIELFKSMTGIDPTLVPYLGSAPALADLLAGRIDAMFDPMPSSIAHIRRGELIPIAVTTLNRSPSLPDVPSAAETVPGYEAGSWFGIGAPRLTPTHIVEKLNKEVNAALADPGMQARISELGGTKIGGPSAQFAEFIARETEKYARVIRSAAIER